MVSGHFGLGLKWPITCVWVGPCLILLHQGLVIQNACGSRGDVQWGVKLAGVGWGVGETVERGAKRSGKYM